MDWMKLLQQYPELCLPPAVGIAGSIVIAVLMVRSPENRRRLLPLGILLPLHSFVFPLLLAFVPLPDIFIDIYGWFTPLLLFGLISYLCVLSRRKQLNRVIWTVAAIWFLYFAAILFFIIVMLCLAHDMSR